MLSLYIPVVQDHITEAYVKRQFADHNIGKVMRVDFVKNLPKNRREAFVHFDEWFDNETSRSLQMDIKNSDTKTRFVYHHTKFFPLLVNKNAHRRINNPEYENIKTEDVKSGAKLLVSIPIETSTSDESKRQRTTTYAAVAAM
jgi:hypothetical protein